MFKTHTHTPQKTPRFYPAEDVKPPRKKIVVVQQNPPRVRKSIQPGTVLVVLAGRFRGKRVICLKVLPSGLALVTGPFKINGVPLRRVNPAYVIATSTTVDISKVDVSTITDEYFSRAKDGDKEGEKEFFQGEAPKAAVVSDERKIDQKKVDDGLLAVVAANDKPHKMKF
jgi:large subunit ribosomal protein L6e